MIKLLYIFFVFILVSGCSMNLGTFKEIRAEAPAEMEALQKERVSGEHCRFVQFFTGFSYPRLDMAVLNAMSKVPGSRGLKDVNVKDSRVPFFNYFCYEVDGVPVK
jgi:hypothetical protein